VPYSRKQDSVGAINRQALYEYGLIKDRFLVFANGIPTGRVTRVGKNRAHANLNFGVAETEVILSVFLRNCVKMPDLQRLKWIARLMLGNPVSHVEKIAGIEGSDHYQREDYYTL
jgi:hypothetical protein